MALQRAYVLIYKVLSVFLPNLEQSAILGTNPVRVAICSDGEIA